MTNESEVEGRPLLDLRPLGNRHAQRGIGRYVRGLVGPCPPDGVDTWTEQRSWRVPKVYRTHEGLRTVMPPRPRLRLDNAASQRGRKLIERGPWRVVHLTDPYGLSAAPDSGRLIVTVYDLIQLGAGGRLSQLFSQGVNRLLDRPNVAWLTISEHIKGRLVRELGIPAEAIVVALPGRSGFMVQQGSVSLGADAPLIVVGALDPHKQPDHALAAAAEARAPIIFAGRHDPQLVTRWGIAPEQLRPDLADPDLAALIGRSRALVHASYEEGFGLAIVEALELGTPVVAYDLPVTREILGDSYPLVPASAGPWGLGALAVELCDPERRRDVVALGQAGIRRLDWDQTRVIVRELWNACRE